MLFTLLLVVWMSLPIFVWFIPWRLLSSANKEWAFTFDFPDAMNDLGFDRRDNYAVNTHPTVLNGFIDLARQEIRAMEQPAIKEEKKYAVLLTDAQEIKVLDVSLIINGVNYDETIELPQEIFPLLMYAYSCALDGPLRNLDDESLEFRFFPWLERNHPRLAGAIMEATEGLLIERIEDDVDGKYRNHINYEEPTNEDDWFELGDNDIRYLIGNLPDRIHNAKRPLSWLLPTLDF